MKSREVPRLFDKQDMEYDLAYLQKWANAAASVNALMLAFQDGISARFTGDIKKLYAIMISQTDDFMARVYDLNKWQYPDEIHPRKLHLQEDGMDKRLELTTYEEIHEHIEAQHKLIRDQYHYVRHILHELWKRGEDT